MWGRSEGEKDGLEKKGGGGWEEGSEGRKEGKLERGKESKNR